MKLEELRKWLKRGQRPVPKGETCTCSIFMTDDRTPKTVDLNGLRMVAGDWHESDCPFYRKPFR